MRVASEVSDAIKLRVLDPECLQLQPLSCASLTMDEDLFAQGVFTAPSPHRHRQRRLLPRAPGCAQLRSPVATVWR